MSMTMSTVTRGARYETGFWIAAYAYVTVMALGTVPSPLYGLYQQRDGFSDFTITLIFAAYSVGTAVSLFLAGHISDWYGRKTILIPGVALSALSAIVFLIWRSLPGLYTGRVLSGLSVGMVAAASTAYMTELHMKSRPGASLRRAQVGGTVANVGGLGLGALVAGLLAEYVTGPLTTTYVVFLVAFAVAVVALMLCPETCVRPVPLPHYRPQRISIPPAAKGQYAAAIGAAFIAFAGIGFFTGLAGTFLVGTLHRTSVALIGTTVFIVFAAAVVVQFATLTWRTKPILVTGMVTLLVGAALTVLAAWLSTPSLTAFLLGGVITGAGAGAMFKGSMATVIMIAEPANRAEAVAGLLLAGYVGLSVPVVGIGIALRDVTPKTTLLGFACVVAVLVVAAAPALLREPTTNSTSSGRTGVTHP
jgi:MFS family permease